MIRMAVRRAASCFFLLLVGSWGALSAVAMAAEGGAPQGVMILHTNQRPVAAGIVVEDTLRKVVAAETRRPVEIYSEYLDNERFATAEYVEAKAAFLRSKYADRNIRIVVAVAPSALQFMLDHRDRALPGAQVVHLALPRDARQAGTLPADFVGAMIDLDPVPTFEMALRLHPGAKRLVVVTGAAERDRPWLRRIQDAVGRLGNRLEAEYLMGLPTAEVLKRLAALPRNVIVYSPGYFVDGAGLVTTPRQSMEWMAGASTAPLYGPLSTFVGTGAVGGVVAPYEEQAKQAGAHVVRLLNGAAPASIPTSTIQSVAVVDWRQLRRWNVDEKLLPAGAIVQFKAPSVWAQYRWYVLGALAIVAFQAAMIAGLLIQRARRRRIEAELEESQRRMELAAGAGEFGMWGQDLSDTRIWASGPMRALFGLGQEEDLTFSDLMARIHPEDSARVRAAIQSAQERGMPFEGEYRVALPGGVERWVLAKGRHVTDSRSTRKARRMGVVIDITERKRAERELAEQRDELARLSRASVLGQLSASIAHEINQPLASILNNAEAARKMLGREGADLAELREICDDIVAENHRAASVIRRLRTLFKGGDMPRQPLDVNDLIEDTLALLHSELLMRHVAAVTDLAPSLPEVEGMRVQLQQVLLNLFMNAAEAMEGNAVEDRKLSVATAMTDAGVHICVSDRGPGIADADLKSIFEPFWSSKPGGMGMGLAICRSIVSVHGGSLTGANGSDGGAAFCIALPAREAV